MKRYTLLGRITGNGVIPIQAVEHDEGNFAHYEDVKELLDWMKNKAEAWKNLSIDINRQSGYFTDVGEIYSDCADELEQKLREIGEL